MARHQSFKQRAANFAKRHGVSVAKATEWLHFKQQAFKEIVGKAKRARRK